MFFSLLMILMGFMIGFFIPITYVGDYSTYFVVATMSVIDSILGAIRAIYAKKYRVDIFLSGLVANSILAIFLVYIGDNLALPLYYSAIFVFGVRIFRNVAVIRHYFLDKLYELHDRNKEENTREQEENFAEDDVFLS